MTEQQRVMAPALTGGNMDLQERLFYLGMVVLRVGYGIVFLTNGLAKLPGFPSKIPPFKGFLIDDNGARNILDHDTTGHPIAAYRSLVEFMLDNWGFFGPMVTALEIFAGVSLILGVITPIGALAATGFALMLQFSNIHRGDKWLFEYFIEWGPLFALAAFRAGRYWGIDSRLARRYPWWPIT